MPSDYKTPPYKASKEFSESEGQKWCVLSPADKVKGYTKPDLINLSGSKLIMGWTDGTDSYLLFQATEGLVSSDIKPSLAKAYFGKKKESGEGWENDEEGAAKWKEIYESSNRWTALHCNFPILKAFTNWLAKTKLIVAELVYLKNEEVDAAKLETALTAAYNGVAQNDENFEDSEDYTYLEKFGLEAIEFEEKPSKNKLRLPPVAVLSKNSDGFLTYEKVFFDKPPTNQDVVGKQQRQYATESAKASSKLEFLLANAENVRKLVQVYDTPELLSLALALVDASIGLSTARQLYSKSSQSIQNAYGQNDNLELSQSNHTNPATELINGFPSAELLGEPLKNLKTIESVCGEAKTKTWYDSIEALQTLDTSYNVGNLVSAMVNIIDSSVYKAEPKNLILWAKENLKVSKTAKDLLDIPPKDIKDLAHAIYVADWKLEQNKDFSILDLKLDDVKKVPTYF